MSDRALAGAARTVVPLRVRENIAREAFRDIGAAFPGWHVWYSPWSGAWNAHREGEEPFFGRPAGGRRFMVAAYDQVSLVVLLEAQARLDIEAGFPGWRVGQAVTGRWYAINLEQTGGGRDGLTRVIWCPSVSGLHAALRDLSHRELAR